MHSGFIFLPTMEESRQIALYFHFLEPAQHHLRYVSLPLMTKLRFTGGFYIEAGPEVSLNVSSSSWEDQSVRDVTKNAELGAGAGIEYQSPIGLGVSLRYTAGRTTVDNTSDATWGDVNFSLGVRRLFVFWIGEKISLNVDSQFYEPKKIAGGFRVSSGHVFRPIFPEFPCG